MTKFTVYYLFIYYRAYCAPEYFDSDCDTFCIPQDNSTHGHFTCDPNDGSKICLPGWSGSKCLSRM